MNPIDRPSADTTPSLHKQSKQSETQTPLLERLWLPAQKGDLPFQFPPPPDAALEESSERRIGQPSPGDQFGQGLCDSYYIGVSEFDGFFGRDGLQAEGVIACDVGFYITTVV